MAFCINCGQELVEGAKFCANCGNAVTSENATFQRKTVYEGTLHKCPNCGEVLNSFVPNCPACGHELRDATGVSSVKQLIMKLEQLEAQKSQEKGDNIFGQWRTTARIDKQKIDLIRNFSIPNTKEDVLEFILLAAANIDLKVYGLMAIRYSTARRELSEAWLSKLEQADQKAEILFGQTQEYISLRNVYEEKMKEIKKAKRQAKLPIIWLLVWFCVVWLALLLLPCVFFLLRQ